MFEWVDCPRCGKEKSSDGEHFCGKCEEKYIAEQEEYEKILKENQSKDIW